MNPLPESLRRLVTTVCATSCTAALALGLTACGDDAHAVNARREIREAAEATGALLEDRWEKQLTAMQAQYEELEAKANEASGAAKEAWERQSAELEQELDALGERLAEARDRGAETAAEWGEQLDEGFTEAKRRMANAADALAGN